MIRRYVTIKFLIFVILLIGGIFQVYLGVKENEQNFKKTIDSQQEMIYNKDKRIEELVFQVQELERINRELAEKQKEVSRGTQRVITCEVSAYSSGDGFTPSDIMANGEIVHIGAVACNFLPFGTKVRINGNVYTVKDRCGIDNCIDIYMGTHEECEQWGRRILEVEIL